MQRRNPEVALLMCLVNAQNSDEKDTLPNGTLCIGPDDGDNKRERAKDLVRYESV